MINLKRLTFVFLLSLIGFVMLSADEFFSPEQKTRDAAFRFGVYNIKRFEQMFQTGNFDFKKYGNGVDGSNILHYVAYMGDLNRVKLLIEKGADINAEGNKGMTSLHFAVFSGNFEVAKWLVENGADVNAKAEQEITVLHWAGIGRFNVKQFNWFLEKINDIEIADLAEKGVIPYIIMGGNLELIKWLFEKAPELKIETLADEELLDNVALSGSLEMMNYFISLGMDIHSLDDSEEENHILRNAVKRGNLELVQWLFEQKIPYNIDELTLVAIQSPFRNIELIKFLIEKGADIANLDCEMFFLYRYNDIDLIQWLIDQGLNISNEYEALKGSVSSGNLEMVQRVISYGNNAKNRGKSQYSALVYAILNWDMDIVRYLVEEEGFDVNEPTIGNYRDCTPLREAAESGDFEMVQYLVEHGANVNPNMGKAIFPFWYVLSDKGGDPEIVKYLKQRDNTLTLYSGFLATIVFIVCSVILFFTLRQKTVY